jgi:hypothetical protein
MTPSLDQSSRGARRLRRDEIERRMDRLRLEAQRGAERAAAARTPEGVQEELTAHHMALYARVRTMP